MRKKLSEGVYYQDCSRQRFHLNSQWRRKLSKIKRQRNYSNLKKQEKTLGKKNRRISNLQDKEFSALVMKILIQLGKSADINNGHLQGTRKYR